MNKKKALIIAIVMLSVAVIFMFLAYFMFHYLTPEGKLGEFRSTPAKPVVTYAVVEFSLLSYFAALVFFLIGIIKPKK
jgi:flagellar basal body-associated protein FliL